MIYLNLFLIALICTIVSTQTDFFETIEKQIASFLKVKCVHIKILECPLCQTWWCGLLYIIVTGNLSLWMIAYTLMLAICTDIIEGVFNLIRKAIIAVITKIDNNIF